MAVQIVVPMAGEGRRFLEAGYTTPKPLIPVSGTPMVVRAVRDLPSAERIILLVRREHIEHYAIDRELRRHLPEARIVVVEAQTEGQACTVRLAAEELVPDWPVIVAACDNTHLYDSARHANAIEQGEVDALVWTYRRHPGVALAPQQYGYVRVDGRRAIEIRCKQTISDNPSNDHVVTGFFTFRCAGQMIDAIDRLVASDERVGGEFYMDVVPNLLLADGCRVEVFEVEKYIGWGTPADYEDFQKWERYFDRIR
ncbi:NTP transferase domain-containing protein [Rubinisphaera margarita]|uniref:NTP transferase domain-containing protein n=1 Tax=Rubinisphaera margarita TaxID=2909586 RepID=UPI001EE92181|nr:NTP transferase domain-containing protein [Rubinisphaera margarita]MCG6154650.1 NTP transferase domain-containing protein [Rubinisphaera margarita]